MAFDKTPTEWLTGWSEDGTDITVPIGTFPELDADEADGTTGDIRRILFALIEKFYQEYNSRDAEDRPTQMRIYKSSSLNPSTGEVANSYSFLFTCALEGQEVKDEPS